MIKHIAVIGAGTMGNGIAHVFAQQGFDVNLIDVDEKQLSTALNTIAANLDRQFKKGAISEEEKSTTISRINTFNEITHGVNGVQLVVEAASENESLKLKIFREMDASAPEDCILATNTSSISITKIAAVTQRADKVVGMHFMNPVPVMKLVEVISGYSTSHETVQKIVGISKQLGKVPCVVNDYPGFIANRILMPMINEAITSLQEGVAGVEEIDTIMKLGMAHPMGPLQLADFIGLDVCHAILGVLHQGIGKPHYVPNPLLSNMVAAGNLGVKSGEGFYRYQQGSKIAGVSERFSRK